MPITENPLQPLTDAQLFATQLALALACGRNKAVTKNKHRTHLCFLAQLLHDEAEHRGKSSPQPPFKA